jgi:uncharacterized protein (DUF3820 family)
MAVMRQPLQQRRRHLGVPEHAGPFGEGQIGRDLLIAWHYRSWFAREGFPSGQRGQLLALIGCEMVRG